MATQWQICAAQSTAGAETWLDCGTLGMSDIVRTRQGDGNDAVTFKVTAATALTDAALFAFHTYVRLRRVDSGVPTLWFFGRIKTPHRRGTGGSSESKSYLVAGPGEQLAATTYRQNWVESAGTISKPRVVLFQAQDGTRCTSGAQILDAVAWAKACGVKIAAPSALLIVSGVALPFDERVNIKCADVVAECLRWHPHAVVWWDYTEREPVFHCALRESLAAISIAAAAVASDIEITERADIKVPAICLCYEKAVQVDDASWSNTYFDHAPVIGGETAEQLAARLNQPDVVWATFDLDGYVRTNVQQEIVTEDFPEDYLDKTWWKEREPWLLDYEDEHITLANGGRKLDTDLPRILKEGTMQTWMNKDAAQERICVDATITAYEGTQIVAVETRPITLWVTATDATTKTYKKTQSLDTGESVPEGVALELYAEWAGLHFEGTIVIEEQECSGTYEVGKALNITGGVAEWAGMKAMIWRTGESVDDGTSTVEFGPIRTLEVDSLVALFRATRNRRFSFNRVFRAGNPPAGDPDGTGAADQTVNPGYSGLSTSKRKVIHDKDASVKHLIDLDSAAFAFATETDGNTVREIKPREVLIPYVGEGGNTLAKLAQCLCSAGYGDEIPLGGARPADPTTPTVLGQDSEGTADDAVTTAYDGEEDDEGVSVWVCTRMRYDHAAATPKLYAYMSKLTWPAAIAPTVTGQTRVEIDTPELA